MIFQQPILLSINHKSLGAMAESLDQRWLMTKESDSQLPPGARVSPTRRGAPNLENAGRRAEDQTMGRP
jgi:hypothetical protein